MVQRGDGNIWAFYVLKPGAAPVQVGTYDDQIVYATIGPDGGIYANSRKGASNGRVVTSGLMGQLMGLAKAPVIVPESKVAIVSGGAEEQQADLDFDSHHVFVRDIIGGPIEVRVFDLNGTARARAAAGDRLERRDRQPERRRGSLFRLHYVPRDVSRLIRPASRTHLSEPSSMRAYTHEGLAPIRIAASLGRYRNFSNEAFGRAWIIMYGLTSDVTIRLDAKVWKV